MSGPVFPLFPGFDARAPRLYYRLPLEYLEYALSARREAARVRRSYAQTTVKDAPSSRQRRRNDSCRRGARLNLCDWEYHADRFA
jgi:hypothetical protein